MPITATLARSGNHCYRPGMSTFRKTVALAALVLVAGCGAGAEPTASSTCAPPPPADVTRVSGWLGHVAASPSSTTFVVDDGRGGVTSHGADQPMPLASAAKVVHLAAYGRAVAEGRVRVDEPVALADWERWYLPGNDGGAHPKAVQRLGVRGTATVDQLVSAMIQESDNSAADWLRARLGDDALVRAAADTGWTGVDLPSFLGAGIALAVPGDAPPADAPRAVRGPAEVVLARRYADDAGDRTRVQGALAALQADQARFLALNEAWAARTASGTAAQLAGMHRALVTGSFGPGADVARRQLEWQGPSPLGTLGFKGGTYLGVLTFGSGLRRTDGTTGVAVILARDLGVSSLDPQVLEAEQGLALGAMTKPEAFSRLACVS